MRFGILLCIVSLAIVIPMLFVWKEQARKKGLQHQKNYQKHIQEQKRAQQEKQRQQEQHQQEEQQKNMLSLQHLPVEQLPKNLQTLLLEVEQVCFALNKKSIPQEQWVTLQRLIHMHLPELIQDYLSLSADYAHTKIIDTKNNFTANQVVAQQLTSIVHFLQVHNENIDNAKVHNILVTGNYLKSLYADNGITPDFIHKP